MGIRLDHQKNWVVVTLPERIDAFNLPELKDLAPDLKHGAKLLALNVKDTRFLSLPTIKILHSIACEIVRLGGRVVLLAPTEKIKRQIDIFASIEPMTIFSTIEQWEVSNGWKQMPVKKIVRVTSPL